MLIDVNGVLIFHQEISGGSDPILMLHGNSEDHQSLLPLARALAMQHSVHLIDSRNHGRSGRHPDVSYAAMAGDVVGCIERLQARGAVSGPMALVGFSDGAVIALLVALARPDLVSKLVLMGPNLSPDDFTPEARRWIEDELASTGSPLMRLMLTEPHISLDELQRIPHPAWVVAGEEDACPRAVFERIAANLPNGQLTVLAGHNHHSYIFGCDLLAPQVLDFLAGTARTA